MPREPNPYEDPQYLGQKMLEWANRWAETPLQPGGTPDQLPSGLSAENVRSLMRGNFRNRLQSGKDQLYQEMLGGTAVSQEAEDLAQNTLLPARPDFDFTPTRRS